ncbi:IS3 family transposase [Myxococcus sp. NMCA1]|uniref:IS3 family transposase n=1 Tax=Myxococcus sp. NMCA1 TaxID=2996785 RepID=UPI003FA606D5
MGFRLFWRWKSRSRVGRPRVTPELRALIRRMAEANPTWGVPRIHGELLKLGMEVGQTTVARYMSRPGRGALKPSPTWQGFLHLHLSESAGMDLFVIPPQCDSAPDCESPSLGPAPRGTCTETGPSSTPKVFAPRSPIWDSRGADRYQAGERTRRLVVHTAHRHDALMTQRPNIG